MTQTPTHERVQDKRRTPMEKEVLPATALDQRPSFLARNRDVFLGLVGAIAVLVAWQVTVWVGWVDPKFSSSPLGAIDGLSYLQESGNLWSPTLSTLQSVGLGMVISMAIGIPLGLVIGRSVVLHGL